MELPRAGFGNGAKVGLALLAPADRLAKPTAQ